VVAASGATSYNVYRNGTKVGGPTGTSYTDSGLSANTTYSYQVSASNSAGEGPKSGTVSVKTGTGGGNTGTKQAAPYLYMGWGDPPNPATVMNATGIKWFTMAFVLSAAAATRPGTASRPLHGGVDASASRRSAAGGGRRAVDRRLAGQQARPELQHAEALAGAYQQVINAYGLKAIDIDIENTDEFENDAVQDRILDALKIVKQNNPRIKTIVTFGYVDDRPDYYGNRLIEQAKALGANIDIFTLMPFDFGAARTCTTTRSARPRAEQQLKSTFGWTDAQAYAHRASPA
jgi:hypothetical protein